MKTFLAFLITSASMCIVSCGFPFAQNYGPSLSRRDVLEDKMLHGQISTPELRELNAIKLKEIPAP